MFTTKRYVPPILSGDWQRDGPNVLKSINDYLLSLEGKQALVIHSGTYTPTITGITNHAASTSAVCQYARVDDVVTVSGVIQHDPTAGAAAVTEFRITLPIASTFSTATQCAGAGVRYDTGLPITDRVAIYGDTTNNEARFFYMSGNAANATLAFTFTYLIS